MPSPLDEVLDAFQALLDARRDTRVPAEAGRGNFRCERCEDCSHCRFCNDCTACEDCTYCDACDGCTGCTHCKHCTRCKQTTHSSWSSECSESSYLTLCLDCKTCVQCFACVGLQNEEFCVLNEKLPRKAYFSRVAALRGALEERMAAGWLPPWAPVVEEAEAAEEVEAAEAVEDEERTPVPLRPEPAALREATPRDDDATRQAARRDEPAWGGARRRDEPAWGEARREEAAALRGELWREEAAALRGEARREDATPPRSDATAPRSDARSEDTTPPRGDQRRSDALPLRAEPRRDDVASSRPEPARREIAPLRAEPPRVEPPRVEPMPMRAEVDSRGSARPEPQWMPPPPPLRASEEDDDRAGRSEITVDVSDDDGPQRSRSAPPWSFASVRSSRPSPTEPDELIPEPPPFGSGAHPVAEASAMREDGSVVPRGGDEPTRRRERAQPVDPPRDRYAWSAQAEGTPVRMGWSVQAEGEPERLSWTSSDDEPDRLRWPMPEPRPNRWSSTTEGPDRASQPRSDVVEQRPKPKPLEAEGVRPAWPPKVLVAEGARPAWPPKVPAAEVTRSALPPKVSPDAPEARPIRPIERAPSEEDVRRARPPKAGWDDPPGFHRDPHENDFDRRRRETAASPSAIALDHPPVAYGRDRPFDPEPPLQLDVWSAYEHLQRSRLGPEEQTEPDAPVARRGPVRADLSGAAVASDDDSGRSHEARTPSRAEATDEGAAPEAKPAPRSLGVARRPERPAPPEPRERGGAMLRGRAPARPNPPVPARQPDAPSLRRARRPSRVRDESTSEYLAVEGPPSHDPERS